MQSQPIARELLLVGGGHSHVIVLRMLGMSPVPGLQVTLVSPESRTPYSGMLPGLIAGHYREDEMHIDLVPLCRFAGARFIRTAVTGIDPLAQRVHCEGRPDLTYDALSIDIGITPEVDTVQGARDQVIPVKPIGDFLKRWHPFLERALAGQIKDLGFVGAGAGGVELCLAIHHRLNAEFESRGLSHHIKFHVFSDGTGVLPEFDEAVRSRFHSILASRGIKLWPDFRVANITGKTLYSTTADQAPLDDIFWVTSAAPQPWLKETGLALTEGGFLKTRDTLQVDNYANIFAVGDTAVVEAHPRPRAGVFAVRQGAPLFRNLIRYTHGQKPQPFAPQAQFLSLISTGDKYAIGSRSGMHVAGKWVWWWKDWIDQRFMQRFSQLPTMPSVRQSGLLAEFNEQMHCGGCGSKVSADILSDVLDELGVVSNRDDAAVLSPPAGQSVVQSIDSFRTFIDDPYVFSRVALNHAMGDIHAMGATPIAALANLILPFAKPGITRSLLRQLLVGALAQLEHEGADLAGGHTSEGSELTAGFAVTGYIDPAKVLSKGNLRPGDQLILTRAIGTGILFAADMQHQAKGAWIELALEGMMQPHGAAVSAFRRHGVNALTDVTGFGLAGHLSEMFTASDCGVALDLDALPVLDGALELFHDGNIRSTLHDANTSSFSMLTSSHRALPLLFDPQTAGGLLASVPADQAMSCLSALRDAGYGRAEIVGEVVPDHGFVLKR